LKLTDGRRLWNTTQRVLYSTLSSFSSPSGDAPQESIAMVDLYLAIHFILFRSVHFVVSGYDTVTVGQVSRVILLPRRFKY
jgi:hypothetical protein